MRTTFFAAIIIALSMLFVSATVWEGVTDVAAMAEAPGSYSVATNAFPRNSIVDVTNLENGKMVRVQVVSGLETAGLLATLSQNAAGALDINDTFNCRIRMTLPPDDIAFANFRLGPIDSSGALLAGNSANGAAALLYESANASTAAEPYNTYDDMYESMGEVATIDEPYNYLLEDDYPAGFLDGEVFLTAYAGPSTDADLLTSIISATETDETAFDETAWAPMMEAAEQLADPVTAAPFENTAEPAAPAAATTTGTGYSLMSLVPSVERIPSYPTAMSPENFAAPIQPNQALPETKPSGKTAPSSVAATTAYTPPTEFSPFPVPLISRLEKGKWYVQVAVFTRSDHVEDELSRIGNAYPLAVQNVGTDTNPLFRILLGPLNQGESEALLQRFKSIGYNDAFVRFN